MKRFWIICTLIGGLVIVPAFIATIAIGVATGEPCETADGAGTCSSDPKLLYGMVPLFLGGAAFGVGLWRWIATSSRERASRPPGQGGGGPFGGFEAWRDSTVNSIMTQYNVPGAAGAANPPPPPPPPPDLAGATGAPPSTPPEHR